MGEGKAGSFGKSRLSVNDPVRTKPTLFAFSFDVDVHHSLHFVPNKNDRSLCFGLCNPDLDLRAQCGPITGGGAGHLKILIDSLELI